MSEPICLDEGEVAALRELIAALDVLERRGLRYDDVIEISRMTWRNLVIRPAQGLRRITTLRLDR